MDKEFNYKSLFKQSRLVYLLLVVGIISIIVALVMGTRIYRRIGHLPPPSPRQTNVSLIQNWMTINYISKTYHVPTEVIIQRLQLDPNTNTKKSLQDLAKINGEDTEVFLKKIQQVIIQLQSSDPSSGKP